MGEGARKALLSLDPDSDLYKQLYIRYYAALSLQYTGYKNLLLELVQSNMSVAVVENIEGIMPYEVIFADKLPGKASEAYMFYPSGYTKLKTGISIYPDDAPESIIDQIPIDADYCLISNNYLMDGEFLIIYCIDNIWYKFTFEMLNNELVKVNGVDIDLNGYKNIWYEKISKELHSEIDITKYIDINSTIDIKVLLSNLRGRIDVTKYNDIVSNIILSPTKSLNSNIIITTFENIISEIKVRNTSNLHSQMEVLRHMPDMNSNIQVRKFSDKVSNIIVTKFNDLNSNLKIRKYSDLSGKIIIKDISDLNSNIEILKYNNLNSNIKVSKYSNIPSNIIITKIENLNSNIYITKGSDLKSNIISTKYCDLISSTFIQYVGFDDKTAKIDVRHFDNLPSFISSDRTVKNLNSNMTIRVWKNNDISSHIFIIGKGKTSLPSHTIIMYRTSINSHINVVKSSTIKGNIIIKPRYFNYLPSKIKVVNNSNLYSNVIINPHDRLTANIGNVYTNSSDLVFNIKIRTESYNYFYGHLYVNNIIELDATEKMVYSGQNNIIAHMIIPTGNNILSNIIINGKNSLDGTITTIPNNTSDINCNIKIATNSDLHSILFIPYKDIMNGTTVITNMGINEIQSNINIVFANDSSIPSTLEVAPHDVTTGNIIIKSSYLNALTSHIDVTNSSSLLSNVFIQPNGLSTGETIITANNRDNISSNIIVTFVNDIASNINVNSDNIINGQVKVIGFGIDLPSKILIQNTIGNDLMSNIEVPYTSPNNMDGTVNIINFNSNGASLNANIKITNFNQLNSTIQVNNQDINKLDVNIIIKPKTSDNLLSNINVRNTSDINGYIIISTLNLAYAKSDIITNVTNSLNSNIIITSFNGIKSNIKVTNKVKLITNAEVVEATDVKSFTPVKDATIMESTPTINYGKSPSLFVGNTPTGHVRSLLGFNVLGIGQPIISAYLIFRSSDYSNFDQLQVYSENYDWAEYGVTWNNAPKSGTYISSKDSTGTKTVISFNVTDYIKYMIENAKTKQIAFSLRQSASIISSTKRFYSRETDQSPILYITYKADVLGHLDSNVLPANITVGTLKSSTLQSYVNIINTHMVEGNNDLNSNIIISSNRINDLYSTIDIKGATVLGNINIRRYDNVDLLGHITTKLYRSSDLNSSINVSKPGINSNIIIKDHSNSDNTSNIIIRQNTYSEIHSTIIMTRTHVSSNVKVAWNNTVTSKIKIRRHSYNEIKSSLIVNVKYIPCNVIVTNTESRMANIIIRQHTISDLPAKLYARPVKNSDLPMNIRIRHNINLHSHISITRPKIDSNIIVRQHANSDLVSSIKIYVFEGYITII